MTPFNHKFIIAVTLFCFFAFSLFAAEKPDVDTVLKNLRENPVFYSSFDWRDSDASQKKIARKSDIPFFAGLAGKPDTVRRLRRSNGKRNEAVFGDDQSRLAISGSIV